MNQPDLGPFHQDSNFCQLQRPHLLLQLCPVRAPLHITTLNFLLQQFIGLHLVLVVTRVICTAPDFRVQITCSIFLLTNTLERDNGEHPTRLNRRRDDQWNIACQPLMNMNIKVTFLGGKNFENSGNHPPPPSPGSRSVSLTWKEVIIFLRKDSQASCETCT